MKRNRRHRGRHWPSFQEIIGPGVTWAMQRAAARFMKKCSVYEAASHETLDHILELNRGTEFARRHGLDGPTRRQVFETLPVTTYADYAPLIERAAAGEQGLMSGEPVVFFSNTSGTTGPPKQIPVTRRQLRMAIGTRITAMGLAIRAGVLPPMHGRFMTIMIDHVNPATSGGVSTGSATTGGFQQLSPVNDFIMTSPGDVSHITDTTASRYLHLLFGLGERRLWAIVSFFPITVLYAMRDLQTYAEEFLRDLADGTITTRLQLAADVRARLERRLRPNPERARELQALLQQHHFTVPEIWPDCGAVLTATGGAFRFYADQLKPYLGELPVFSPVYSASEGTIGYGFSAGDPYYLLVPELAFVEFLPLERIDDPQAIPIPPWQAEAGADYEIVITTLAGFVRYRLYDVVRVREFVGQNPVIEFVEREGQVINVSSEKTAEHHIVEAMEIASRLVDKPLVDYFVSPNVDQTPGVYLLALEGWQHDSGDNRRIREFVAAVESALCKVAPYYLEERELGTVGPMEALLLKPGAFERYRRRLIEAGRAESQLKTPHAIPDPGFVDHHFRDEILARLKA